MSSRDAEPTRNRILDAAGEMFADRGFQAVTVREICQSAGANLAAVNYYFGDKQQLYLESVKQAHRWHMDRASLPAWSNDTPAADKLRGFIHTFLLRVRSGPSDSWQTRLMMRELKQQDEICVAVVEDSIRPQFEILIEILREMLPPETSEEKLHLTAFSIVGQCLFYHLADPVVRTLLDPEEYAGYHVEKLSRHISEFVLAALVPKNVGHKKTLPPL
jgi:TetR/AcrR family transcriptional regulator, regulator of cefoperazone and chloramphenicol sensitivity